MLTIGLHVRDTNSYVKCLGISHNAAILDNVRDVPIYFSRPSVILKKCVMSLFPSYFATKLKYVYRLVQFKIYF